MAQRIPHCSEFLVLQGCWGHPIFVQHYSFHIPRGANRHNGQRTGCTSRSAYERSSHGRPVLGSIAKQRRERVGATLHGECLSDTLRCGGDLTWPQSQKAPRHLVRVLLSHNIRGTKKLPIRYVEGSKAPQRSMIRGSFHVRERGKIETCSMGEKRSRKGRLNL